jgi:hypothetical protein
MAFILIFRSTYGEIGWSFRFSILLATLEPAFFVDDAFVVLLGGCGSFVVDDESFGEDDDEGREVVVDVMVVVV